jgi:hypothetical protein
MARRKYDMINEVLAHFDFEKVHETMTLLNWTWAGEGIPSIKQLKETADNLLNGAAEQVLSPTNTEHHEVGWISATGGFKAMAWKNKNGTLSRIQLEFIVTEWDAEDDSEEAE